MTMTATEQQQALLDEIEIWESATDSAVWLWVVDRLGGQGAWKKQKVGGSYGNKRIQISVRERRYNQDQIPEANSKFDPFLNGSLICRQGADQSPNGFSDAQLIQLLETPAENDAQFELVVTEHIKSEVLLRRLLGLAERHAPSYRHLMLQDLVDERYRVGYTQRSQRTDLPEKGVGNGVLISG